jgi:hypothetical protein
MLDGALNSARNDAGDSESRLKINRKSAEYGWLAKCRDKGMPATGLQPAASVANTCAVAIGAVPLNSQLRALLSGSHWNLEWAANPEAAIERLNREPVPVVISDAESWGVVVEASRKVPRPPTVFVFATKPDDKQWLDVLAAGACYVDSRHLDARHLFSLLNHAWRVWNKE